MSSVQSGRAYSILASVPNLRDAGGHATLDGRRVHTGVLYRSEQLSNVADADVPALRSLGLRKIYDLRTHDERAAQPDRVPDGAQAVVVDVLADEIQSGAAALYQLFTDPKAALDALGGGKAAQIMTKVYVSLINLPSARAGFATMFRELAVADNLPALFHCTTGKDRTGWTSAALLALCGVAPDDVMQDYLASNDYILPEYQPLIDKFEKAGVDPGILTAVLGVRKEYLETSFAEVNKNFGSIEGYFAQGLGIDANMQQALRSRLIEID